MEKINLSSKNIVKVEVNDDGEHIAINLGDVDFPRRFEKLYRGLQEKMAEIQKDVARIDAMDAREQTEFMYNTHKEIMSGIDNLFGQDTCRKVFGDIVPDMALICEFFEQITPILKKYGKIRNSAIAGKYNPGRKGARR